MPFFSIVIPTFNQCDFLKVAISSVLNQSYKNYEIIVIDNFSKDGTHNFIKTLKKKVIYRRIKNRGIIAKSRNLGIKIAKGKWICFLDSDDSWSDDKLKKTYDLIKINNFDLICNDEWVEDKTYNTKKFWSYGPFEKNFYENLILFGNRNSTSASSVKKNFLINNKINFNEKKIFVTAEDYDFFLKIAFHGGVFHYLHEPLGTHVFHEKSESAKLTRLFKAQMNVLKFHSFKIQKFSNKNKLWKKIKDMNNIKYYLFYSENKRNFSKFFSFILAILKRPFSFTKMVKMLFEKNIKQYILTKKFKSDF